MFVTAQRYEIFPMGGVNFKGIITYINFARPNYTTETKQTEKQPDMHL